MILSSRQSICFNKLLQQRLFRLMLHVYQFIMSCQCPICRRPDKMLILGQNKLHKIVSCKKNRISLIRKLLKVEDLDIRDGNGNTPLHVAASNEDDNIEIVEELIRLGANVSAINKTKSTPLIIAVKRSNRQILEVLLRHKADVNAANGVGYTALHFAILNHVAGNQPDTYVIQRLLDAGANINQANGLAQVPLLLAVAISDLDIVQKILKAGGDVNVYNHNSETCLHIALRRPHRQQELVEELIKYGANIAFKDSWYMSPLEIAVNIYTDNPSEGYQILKSLIKMAILVQPNISFDIDDSLKLCPCMNEFREACYSQVSRMGYVQFTEHISLQDFVLRGITCSVFSDSNILSGIYNYGLYALLFESYVIYNDWIISHLPRKYLTEVLNDVKIFSTDRDGKVFTIVPDVVIKISGFLTCSDIVRLIKAFLPHLWF